MQKLDFDNSCAQESIYEAQKKLGYGSELQEYTDRQFFLSEKVTLWSGEVQRAILEFRASIYKSGKILFVPLWIDVPNSVRLLLSIDGSVLAANYEYHRKVDLTKLDFLNIPYTPENKRLGYTHNAVHLWRFWIDIERIVVVTGTQIWGIEKIMKLHEQ